VTTKLSLQHVRKSFPSGRGRRATRRVVLDDVSLDIAEHQVVCLIGASGSGKSTLLRCINLLEPIDDGAIVLDGVDISAPGLDPDPIRRRIGMVFQSYNLFPHMSVLRNITLAPRTVLRLDRAEAEQRGRQLLERLGLGDKADAFPDQLSGGQQQRVAIVRALAMRPELMLLDEVTAALDPVLVGEVLNVIRDLRADGMTMVLATHEMGFAREIADNTAPVSVALNRHMIWKMLGADHPMEAHKVDSKGIYERGKSADVKEGVIAFLEKRPAKFPMKVSSGMPSYFPWWKERTFK